MNSQDKDFERMFDEYLNNYLMLEKTILEMVGCYKQNPVDYVKFQITNLCSIGMNQVRILMDIARKIMSGKDYNYYKENLQVKYDDLVNISNEISLKRENNK